MFCYKTELKFLAVRTAMSGKETKKVHTAHTFGWQADKAKRK